jgi:hypothetical protein
MAAGKPKPRYFAPEAYLVNALGRSPRNVGSIPNRGTICGTFVAKAASGDAIKQRGPVRPADQISECSLEVRHTVRDGDDGGSNPLTQTGIRS